LERAHRRMAGTRGGAIGIVQVTGAVARFAGLGNVAASILSDGTRKSMLSVPGIAGFQARVIRQFDYDVPAGAAVILHSDGISSRWEVAAVPGLAARDPLVIAAVLLAEAGGGAPPPRRRGGVGAQVRPSDRPRLDVRDVTGVYTARQLGRGLAAGL